MFVNAVSSILPPCLWLRL